MHVDILSTNIIDEFPCLFKQATKSKRRYKKMNKYEILYIIDNDVSEEDKAALVDRFSDLVVKLGGAVDGIDKWGTRKYAYPINDKNEGYYVLMNFTADASAPAEIDRQMKITDAIVRQMIIRK